MFYIVQFCEFYCFIYFLCVWLSSSWAPTKTIKSNFITFNHIYFKSQIDYADNKLHSVLEVPIIHSTHSNVEWEDATFILRGGKRSISFAALLASL